MFVKKTISVPPPQAFRPRLKLLWRSLILSSTVLQDTYVEDGEVYFQKSYWVVLSLNNTNTSDFIYYDV